MPEYKIHTDQGEFKITTDLPASAEQLEQLLHEQINPSGVSRALEGQTRAAEAVGQTGVNFLRDIKQRAERPQPLGQTQFQGLTTPVPEGGGQKLPGVGVTPDVKVPRAAKQLAVQLPGAAVAGGFGAAGAEFARQKLSGEETNLVDVGLAGVFPGMGRVVGGAAKSAGAGLAAAATPSSLRNAGIDVIEEIATSRVIPRYRFLGTTSDSIPAHELFAQAKKAGPIPTDEPLRIIRRAIQKESRMTTPNKALTRLKALEDGLSKSPAMDADQYIAELQRLRKVATANFKTTVGADPTVGETLEEAAKGLIDHAPEAYKKGIKAWRREQSVLELLDEMEKANTISAFRKTMRSDPVLKGAFNPVELADIEKLAAEITRIPTGVNVGSGNRLLNAFFTPLARMLESKSGRAVLRMLMRDPDITAGRLAQALGQVIGVSTVDAFTPNVPQTGRPVMTQ